MFCFVIFGALLSTLTGVRGQYCSSCWVDGVCRTFGERWTKECTTYECRSIGAGWTSADVVQSECKDADGKCRYNGETMPYIIDGRRRENCKCIAKAPSTTGYSCSAYSKWPDTPSSTSRCTSCKVDGVCKAFGDRWVKDCFTFECMRNGSGWRTEVVKAECKDAYGQCKKHNEYMTVVSGGVIHVNCQCSIYGLQSSYSC